MNRGQDLTNSRVEKEKDKPPPPKKGERTVKGEGGNGEW